MEVDYQVTETLLPETKVCTKCHVAKPMTEYRSVRYGSRNECKSCESTYYKNWCRARENGGKEMDTSTDDALYVMTISKLPGIVKIGRSKNPKNRAYELAACQPFYVNVDREYQEVGFMEQSIHKKLAPYRVEDGNGREWFNVSVEQADAIIQGEIALYELSVASAMADV
jgi:hypothetical protein